MNARRLVKYSLICLGVVATAAAIAVLFVVPSIDAEYYRPFIEKKARALTGRDLTIGGPLRLRLTTRLAIVASDVRLANVAPGTYPDILRVGRLDAEVGLLPLLRGIVRIDRLHLQGPRVFLETDAAGSGNWAFTSSPRSDTALPWKLEIALDEVSLADARIEFRNGKTARRYELSLAQVTADRNAMGAFLLDGRGTFGDSALSLRVLVRSSGAVFAPRSRVELTLAATLAANSIAASGTIEDMIAIRDVDMRLSINGKELAAAARDLGWEAPTLGPYELAGRLSGSREQLRLRDIRFTAGREDTVLMRATGEVDDVVGGRGAAFDVDARIATPERVSMLLGQAAAWLPAVRINGRLTQRGEGFNVDRLALTLGQTLLSGHARVELPRGPPRVSAKIHAATIDLSQLPARKTASLKTSLAQALDSAAPLKLEWMHKLDADLELDADVIRLPREQSLFRPSVHLLLRSGQLTLAPLRVQLTQRAPPISARLIIESTSIGVRVMADAAGASIELADLLAIVGPPVEIEGALTQVDIELRSSGSSPRELTSGLNGNVKLVVGRGHFDSDTVDFGARLLTRLLGLTQTKEQRRAELICGAVYLPIRNGVVMIDRNIAIHTSNVTIVASGIVDLSNESMEMYVYTRATEGLGLEAGKLTNMFKIQGVITAPTVSVNPKGVVTSGLSIGAAVATGGASLLFEGFARKAAGDRDPCGTALKSASAR